MKKIIFWAVLLLGLALPSFAQENGYQEALRLIEEARVSGATSLSLSGLGLTELPPELWELENLQLLRLEHNQLSSLPPEISKLRNLCFLYLGGNSLTALPTELGQLHIDGSEPCSRGYAFFYGSNQLVFPPQEILEQGPTTILAYLRNEAWWHLQRLIAGAVGSMGLVAAIVLGWRWKNRRGRKEKEKQD